MLTNEFPCLTTKHDTQMNVQASYFMSGLSGVTLPVGAPHGQWQNVAPPSPKFVVFFKIKRSGTFFAPPYSFLRPLGVCGDLSYATEWSMLESYWSFSRNKDGETNLVSKNTSSVL